MSTFKMVLLSNMLTVALDAYTNCKTYFGPTERPCTSLIERKWVGDPKQGTEEFSMNTVGKYLGLPYFGVPMLYSPFRKWP